MMDEPPDQPEPAIAVRRQKLCCVHLSFQTNGVCIGCKDQGPGYLHVYRGRPLCNGAGKYAKLLRNRYVLMFLCKKTTSKCMFSRIFSI